MAIYDVDFIFYCPCFFSDIFETRYLSYNKNYEFEHFICRRYPNEDLDVDDFRNDKTIFVCCFFHLG